MTTPEAGQTMTSSYGADRRRHGITEDRVQVMIQEAVSKALAAHEQHLTTHMDNQFRALRQTITDAFPNGDPHGHRIAHEKAIANASWWDKAKSDAFSKVTAAGLWAVLVFLAVAAWEQLKAETKK
jgi:hypothetical protein